MAVVSKVFKKKWAEALVSAYPTGVLVDIEGRAVSSEFRVAVDDSGDVTNIDEVKDVTGTPDTIRLLDGNGSWYEIALPPRWI